MRTRNLFICAAAALMTFVSCDLVNQDLGTPKISVDPKEINFEIAGGEQTITVTSTRDWTFEADEDWVTVSPETGTASTEAQTVTISVLANEGKDRDTKVKFICGGGMANAVLTVKQTGPGGTNEAIYFNDFDKEVATEGSKGWPFLDQFEGWKNATGTGVANVEYASSAVSVRANGNAEKYYDYEGSRSNNLFFGKESPYFAVKNIALGGRTDLVLTFGTEKYSQDNGSVFKTSEFHVWLSVDGAKWVDLKEDYSFAGGETEGRWNIATAKFSVPAGTETLSICLQSDVASSYRVDDLKLDSAIEAGKLVDFTAAVDKDFNAGGSTGGNEGGADTPAAEYTIPQVAGLENGTKAIVKGHIVGRYKNGFMMSDGTDNLLVYENDKPSTHPIGTKVIVTAEKSTYSGQAQLKNVASLETDGTVEVTYPEPMVITAANIAELEAITVPTYVSYTGKLEKSGNYYNVVIEGSEAVSGSVSYPDDAMVEKITPWVNGTVAVKGYYIGLTNQKKVAGTMVTEISLVGDAPEPPAGGGDTEDPGTGGGETDNPGETPEIGNPMVLDVKTLPSVLGVEFGNNSYGGYGEKVVSGTINGVGLKASNVCANGKDGTLRINAAQFIQMRKITADEPAKSGFIANTTAFAAKSIKVWVLSSKDKAAIYVGSEADPTTPATTTSATETVTIAGYDGDMDVTMNVYTVDMSGNPTFFNIMADGGAAWIYKVEIGY